MFEQARDETHKKSHMNPNKKLLILATWGQIFFYNTIRLYSFWCDQETQVLWPWFFFDESGRFTANEFKKKGSFLHDQIVRSNKIRPQEKKINND